MKIRPSYKQQALMPLVVISVSAHTLLFSLSGGFFKPAPEYAVINAKSSMEVVLLEEPKTKQLEQTVQEKVLTVAEAKTEIVQEEKETVEEIEEKPVEEQEEIPQPVISSPDKGVVEESQPEYLRNPAPVYPRYAQERGWEGLVMLKVFVDQLGTPTQVLLEKTSGRNVLDQAAIKAVRKWQFKPASLGNVAFSAWIEIPIRFVLD